MNIYSVAIPHLNSPEKNFFFEIENHILEKQTLIESWFRDQWQLTPPMLTCSVDIRNAGFKLSAIDANLFPAGFNNLNPDFMGLNIQAFQYAISARYPNCKNILIIPENHTRNRYYYESLATLQSIIKRAGYHVQIGSWLIDEIQSISLSNNERLLLYPTHRSDNKLVVDNFTPCLILLNNDLSEGIPDCLRGLSQTIDPLPELGWAFRSKATHFNFYKKICDTFSTLINIDSWKICPFYSECSHVDFQKKEGIDCLVDQAELLFSKIKEKYEQYNITSHPFIILKPDAGTYGKGVITIRHPKELQQLNRKERQNLSSRKGNQPVHKLLLQEGIPTIEIIGEQKASAEPVVYLLGQSVIGGFYRLHPLKGKDESLNSPGMSFEPLAFSTCCNTPDERLKPHHAQNRFYVYSVIARLSLLATCHEKKAFE